MKQDEKIVLYYCVTHYHLLCSILHKIKYHKMEKAVVCFPARNNDCKKVVELLSDSPIFDEVYLYEEYSNNLGEKSEESVIEEINKFVEEFFPVKMECCKEINVFNDTYSFGTYLVLNGIPYNFFEDGRGRLSTEEQLLKHLEKIYHPTKISIIKKIHLLGNASNVMARYGDLSAQEEGYYNKKDIHFSTSEILADLEDCELEEVLRVFGMSCNKIEEKNAYTLILTQHYVNLNLMSMEEQKDIYLCMADYFSGDNKLIIKPHPSDIHGLYHSWFPNAIILDRFFPAELIPYCLKRKYEVGMAVSSTAIKGLSNVINKVLCFDLMMENTYRYMHKYFVALVATKQVVNDTVAEVLNYGLNVLQLKGLNEFYPEFGLNMRTIESFDNYLNDKSNKCFGINVIIIDQINEEYDNMYNLINNLNLEDVVIFLDTDRNAKFIIEDSTQILDWVFPIEIQIKQKRIIRKEYIYVYTKNERALREIYMLEINKILQYSDAELIVDQKEKTEIKILTGINQALENRMAELVKAYNALKENK